MRRSTRSLSIVAVAALGAQLWPSQASAQFVCVDSANSTQGATATGSADNMACGSGADADGVGSFNAAVGRGTSAFGDASGNTAMGNLAGAYGDNSFNTALGHGSGATGDDSRNTAVGNLTNAGGDGSRNTAIGYGAWSAGNNAHNTALGDSALATGDSAANVAIGQSASASGNGMTNTAIGAGSRAYLNSVAVGGGAEATFLDSAAFGTGATATRDHQQVFGTTTSTYTMAGSASADSKAAQGAPTHLVTSNASGDLAAYSFADLGFASSAEVAGINARIKHLDQSSDNALQGVAMAFALAGAPSLAPNETFAMSGGWGGYEGKSGVAIGAALKLDGALQLNGGVAYGVNEGTVGGRAALRVGW